jgi:hypothetical protein
MAKELVEGAMDFFSAIEKHASQIPNPESARAEYDPESARAEYEEQWRAD